MANKNFNAKKVLMSTLAAVAFSFVFTTNADATSVYETRVHRVHSPVHFSFVVPKPNEMSWGAEGIPRDVEPADAGKELVGMFTSLEEGDEQIPLLQLRTDTVV